MKGREDGARSSFRTVAILVAMPLCGVAIFLSWNWLHGGISPRELVNESERAVSAIGSNRAAPDANEAARRQAAPRLAQTAKVAAAAAAASHGSERSGSARSSAAGTLKPGSGRIVLIIDDLGFDRQPLDRLMALDPNVNCSILPNATRATEFAEKLHARGFEILCHLPMQPRGKAAPGRGAILTSMSDHQIGALTRDNIARVPYARGLNNHMGSLATADRRVMSSVLAAVPEGMYFVDSRTDRRSVAAAVAREMNVPTATRHVFLDDVASEAAVRRQVAELAAVAEKRGVAIGIGHPYRVTMNVLADELPRLRARGFRLIRASEAVR